jgi:hypothetical protein
VNDDPTLVCDHCMCADSVDNPVMILGVEWICAECLNDREQAPEM